MKTVKVETVPALRIIGNGEVNRVEKIAVGICNFICIEREITDAKQ